MGTIADRDVITADAISRMRMLGEYEINQTMKMIPRETQKATALRKDGDTPLKRLESEVQHRLWNAEKIDNATN
jgi:hypothetical protein